MKGHQRVCIFVLAIVTAFPAASQLQPGVVVEEVKADYAGKTAGVRVGDVFLAWSCGGKWSTFNSPFELSDAELNKYACQQPLKVVGRRGTKREVWSLPQRDWGIDVRPNFNASLESLFSEATNLAKMGQWTDALERSQRIEAQLHNPNPWLESSLLFLLAQVLRENKEWKGADELYRAAAERAAGIRPLWKAEVLYEWAGACYDRNDWTGAIQHYEEALSEAKREDHDGLAVAQYLNGLGAVALAQENLQEAKRYFQQVVKIDERRAPGSLVYGINVNNLGTVAQRMGDLTVAERYYRRDLAIEERLNPNSVGLAATLSNLGTLVLIRGEVEDSEKYFRRALEITEKVRPGGVEVAMSLHNLSAAVAEKGDLDSAQRYLQRSLAIKQKVAPKSLTVASTLVRLGIMDHKRGNLDEAGRNYGAALAIFEKLAPHSLGIAATLARVGDLSQDRGDLSGAIEYYKRALAIKQDLAPESISYADTLAALAGTMRKINKAAEAADLYERALTAVEAQTAHLGGSAETRMEFRGKQFSYYKDYAELLLTQNKPRASFQVVERSRAQALLEILSTGQVEVRNGLDDRLLERQHVVEAELTEALDKRLRTLSHSPTQDQAITARKRVEDVLTQLEAVNAEVQDSSPQYSELFRPKPLSAQEVQSQLLDADTMLLEYLLGDHRSHVWLVQSGSITSYDLPSRREIEDVARRVYDLLTAPNRWNRKETSEQRQQRLSKAQAEYPGAAQALSRMVLGPVAGLLGTKRLLIVSEGVLQYIPFAALPEPGKGASETSQRFSPLIATHEIVNLPSATVLAVLRRAAGARSRGTKAIAVVADPVFDSSDRRVTRGAREIGPNEPNQKHLETASTGDSIDSFTENRLTRSAGDVGFARHIGSDQEAELSFPRLLFSRNEANAILAATPPGQGMAALDFEANRATVTSDELSRYRIVHFATHGLLDSRHPEFSGLVFSLVDNRGNPQEGFLSLQDIYNLRLPADLVVLSACETALGKEVKGEGLIGLTRGFMYAGATRVVASLWNVDDAATAELMGRFYRAMEQDGMRPAAALRAAQLDLSKRNRWAAPYYWAGFQIQGEWK